MTLSRSIRAGFLAGAVLMFSAQAQTLFTGELTGTVTDPAGAVVAGAKVDLTSQATGQQSSVASSSTGEFRFSLLPPGVYTLSVSAPGFEVKSQPATIELGQSSNLTIQLGVQAKKEDIVVTGEAPLLQSNNADLATTFAAEQIENLPDPGGDMTAFAFTAPGVTPNTSNGSGASGIAAGNLSVFGLPAISNLFTVNGVDVTSIYYNSNPAGATGMTLGTNEIQEAAVVMNGYLGQYGRLAGANINYITKSGGNVFHGNALWNYNGRVLNANDFFNNANGQPRPFAISNTWADSLGGPILKNKLFFFVDNEGMRYEIPTTELLAIPTPAFANFVLTGLNQTNSAALPLYEQAFSLYAGAPGAASATPVPLPVGRGGCSTLSNPTFGVSESCAEKFQFNESNPNSEWLLTGRADYNLDNSDRFYVRLNTDHGTQSVYTDPISSAFNIHSSQPTYRAQFGYTRTITSHSVNTLLLDANYNSAVLAPSNLSATLATFPTTFEFTVGDFYPLGGHDYLYPGGRKTRQWQLVDDYSFVKGRHTLRAGVNLRQSWISSYFYGAETSGVVAFGSLSDFVNGSLSPSSSYTQAVSTVGAEDVSVLSAGFYAQDEWRALSNLMVTLSLRLDRNSNPQCPGGCFTELTGQGSFDQIAHSATLPYNQSIQTGLTSAFGAVDAITPQPRVGIAYSLTKSTVLRGGVGIFADSNPAALFDRFITNAPAEYIATTFSGLVAPESDPSSIFANVVNSAQALRTGFANGATLAQLEAAVPNFVPPQLFTISSPLHTPRYYEWNVELQQAFSQRYLVSVDYVGNHGSNELVQNVAGNGYSPQGYAGLPTSAPDPRFGQIDALNNQGWSNYNGLVSSFKWRMSSQFSGQFSYTWSHALDTCSNDCVPAPFSLTESYRFQFNPVNLQSLNYGDADYDVRHSLSANYLYAVPTNRLENRILKTILGGWKAGGTVFFHTGYPFSIVDPNVLGKQFLNFAGKVTQPVLADFLGGSSYPSCTTPNVPCYPASEFATATTQHDFGNLPRNSFRGPGYFDTDLNLNKAFAVAERYKLLIGASFFNILNHPNFAEPVNNVASTEFGYIVSTVSAPTSAYGSFAGSAVSGRVIQTQIRFSF